MSVNNGLDLELMSTHEGLLDLVKSGKISEETINESVRRILKIKFELGLFEEPFVNEKDAAKVVERTVDTRIRAEFSYVVLNDVMRIIKEEQPTIEEQIFDNLCTMRLSVRNSKADIVLGRLRKVEGAIVEVIE